MNNFSNKLNLKTQPMLTMNFVIYFEIRRKSSKFTTIVSIHLLLISRFSDRCDSYTIFNQNQPFGQFFKIAFANKWRLLIIAFQQGHFHRCQIISISLWTFIFICDKFRPSCDVNFRRWIRLLTVGNLMFEVFPFYDDSTI